MHPEILGKKTLRLKKKIPYRISFILENTKCSITTEKVGCGVSGQGRSDSVGIRASFGETYVFILNTVVVSWLYTSVIFAEYL